MGGVLGDEWSLEKCCGGIVWRPWVMQQFTYCVSDCVHNSEGGLKREMSLFYVGTPQKLLLILSDSVNKDGDN